MSSQVPKGDRRAAIISGEFVPLTIEEFRNGYATFSDGLDGKLPRDPDFPTEYHDAVTGGARPVEDTPFNRAWIAAGKLFTDEAKRISFYQRVEKVMPIAADKKTASMSTARRGPSISRSWPPSRPWASVSGRRRRRCGPRSMPSSDAASRLPSILASPTSLSENAPCAISIPSRPGKSATSSSTTD
jgi:hypothetical protein